MWDRDEFRIVFGTSEIEYNPDKESVNREKHGYSLEGAAQILSRIALPIPQPKFLFNDREVSGERRYECLTEIVGKIVFFVLTMRDGEKIRIISFRDASKEEREIYRSL